MDTWGLLNYLWVQPWARSNSILGQPCDRNKLSLGAVRTHYIIVERSDNLCISSKIKKNQPLDVKSDELYTCWRYFVNKHA